MSNISFYHVSSGSFEKSICQIIEKCYLTEKRTFIKFSDLNFMNKIDEYLWIYSQKNFIPHGTYNSERSADHPVLLSTEDDLINNPENLILIGSDFENISYFTRVIIMFDDENEELKNFSRSLFKKYKQNHDLLYFKQDIKGNWSCIENI